MKIQLRDGDRALQHSGEPRFATLSDDSMQMIDVIGLVRRRIGIIVVGLVAGLLLATLYYFQAQVIYESEVQVLVDKKDSNLSTQGTEGTDAAGRETEDMLADHMMIITSRAIISAAIEAEQLDKLPYLNEAIDDDETATKYIIDHLKVTRGGSGQAKGASVITLTFHHTSPEECSAILNAIVVNYEKFLAATFENTSSEAVALIEAEESKLAQEIKDGADEYLKLRKQSPLLWNGEQSLNVHQVRLNEIETQAAALKVRQSSIKTRLAVINEKLTAEPQGEKSSDVLALFADRDIQRLSLLISVEQGDSRSEAFMSELPDLTETARTEHDQLITLRLKKGSLASDLGDRHPQVLRIQQQIEDVEKFLAGKIFAQSKSDHKGAVAPEVLIKTYVKLLQNDLEQLAKEETELTALAEQERTAAKTLVIFELQGEMLRNELERKQNLYDTVLEQLSGLNRLQDYGGFITEILSPVELGKKSYPVLVLVLAFGAFGGLLMGTGAAVVVDLADSTFRQPEEISDALGLAILAHVPEFSMKSNVPLLAGPDGRVRIDESVVAYHRPKSREAEAFRGLRSSLFFTAAGRDSRVLQFTSPTPGDGKSTLVANLAVSLAQAGKSVLLVDCDMRRPRIHELFHCDTTIGLSALLVGDVDVPDVAKETEVENLQVIPCGSLPPNPAELLSLPRFEEFVHWARDHYDFVLLDSPPVLAVSDASEIAARADGIVLAVRIRKNGRPSAERAKQMLVALDANIIGVAVNYIQSSTNGYGYGAYGYGAGDSGQYYEQSQDHNAVTTI